MVVPNYNRMRGVSHIVRKGSISRFAIVICSNQKMIGIIIIGYHDGVSPRVTKNGHKNGFPQPMVKNGVAAP